MALIKCRECGKEISSDAKACPHCGAKPKTGIGCGPVLGIILVGFIAWLAFGPSPTPPAPKTEAEQQATTRMAMAAAAAKALKQSLREPDSLDIISIKTDQLANIICLEYRAKNGFGGTSIEHLVVLPKRSSDKAADWNKHCPAATFDTTFARHML